MSPASSSQSCDDVVIAELELAPENRSGSKVNYTYSLSRRCEWSVCRPSVLPEPSSADYGVADGYLGPKRIGHGGDGPVAMSYSSWSLGRGGESRYGRELSEKKGVASRGGAKGGV